MKRIEISARELASLSHCCSDKVLCDLFEKKGIDTKKPFTRFFDTVRGNLVVEQEN